MKIKQGPAAQKQNDPLESQAFFHGKTIPRIWVVVADNHKAVIYQKDGQNQLKNTLEVVVRIEPDTEFIRTKARRNTGHIANAGGGSVFYSSNPLDHENHHDEKIFAKAIAQWLEKADNGRSFDRLVLAAEPRALGNLREALNKSVDAKITAVLNKDLTNMPRKELESYLEETKFG